ncbi:hypothetical protein [Sphingopyxis sp. DBS4]|uniref:hypothetical protein n=1 Tax=Sphingopyxis sp. DBS4 TaxID=2968500 RepID=UPI00214CE822|nr:hypothetical protein [Sphingopyxis sp. DBS4]
MGVITVLLLLLFPIAQGAVIFGTAYLWLRMLETSSRSAKASAMAVSYAVWIAVTIGGYTMLGGEGGLMDGFGLVLILCFTALLSSFVYLVLWTRHRHA